eukprot:964436-Pyramimonas_sp.AAC.1
MRSLADVSQPPQSVFTAADCRDGARGSSRALSGGQGPLGRGTPQVSRRFSTEMRTESGKTEERGEEVRTRCSLTFAAAATRASFAAARACTAGPCSSTSVGRAPGGGRVP